MVTININGIDVQASKDKTVLEAAEKASIYILPLPSS